MKEKDPYLSELDEFDEADELGPDEPTRIDLEAPHESEESEPCQSEINEEGPVITDESSLLGLTSDLPVQLVAVMGRKGITVKDLLGYRVGQVVSFDKKPFDAVEIIVNGKIIGRGELVDLDGKLGVRILKLLK